MIQITNAHYIDATGIAYDVDVTIDGKTFDYTVHPDDPAALAVAIRAAMAETPILIAAHTAPPAPVPQAISDRQFFQQLAIEGAISQAEALAAVKTGDIPAALQAIVDGITDPAEKFAAEMLLSGATVFMRSHPLATAIGQATGRTPAQVDEFWRNAATL